MLILQALSLRKTYWGGEAPVEALRGVNLELDSGEFVAVMGPSGCGKSTLLHICGAMDRPTEGRLQIEGISIEGLSDDGLTHLRRTRLGFVFQFFSLLPSLNVLENVSLPLYLAGLPSLEVGRRAQQLLRRVGLGHRMAHYPQQLSGGELQRCAIARAIVHSPALLIADEPTGNLDSESGAVILALLSELNLETGVTILLATHSSEIASAANRVVRMRDGKIERVEENKGAKQKAEERRWVN
jgi:putative ABC transport system ATP-binding protein